MAAEIGALVEYIAMIPHIPAPPFSPGLHPAIHFAFTKKKSNNLAVFSDIGADIPEAIDSNPGLERRTTFRAVPPLDSGERLRAQD
jgi:hypothetical protein